MSPNANFPGDKSSRDFTGAGKGNREVLDAEIVESANASANGRERFQRAYHVNFNNGSWRYANIDADGCLAPSISIALFLVCLGQYGLLAAIGFAVFHIIGSIAGAMRAARKLTLGQPFNPWLWRLGNWFVSFLLTVWLAGGFNQ